MSADSEQLEALIAGLALPGVLPGGGDGPAEVVHTHISAVFLSGDRAFKLKKPVDFGFLDFSTPLLRARFCREELRLNRRLAPEVYIGLSPVWRRPGGRLEVGAPTDAPPPADELLVVMSRLPRERMLDVLLAAGGVEREHIERLARTVARFHSRAERGPDIDRWGARDNAGRHALDNFDQTARFRGSLFDAAEHDLLRARTAGFLESRERLFSERIERGAIRDLHGDLHSPNICVLPDGRPVVYDCIEFSPAYRCGDVASEVAFATMDLTFRGRDDLAQTFLATYEQNADDPDIEAMLPFYRTYRAMVRAKVSALTAAAPEVPPPARDGAAAAARRLFALAGRYSCGLTPPALVVLAGLTGVGKTAVAEELRRVAGFAPLETDRIRKQLAGLDPARPATAGLGEGIYTPAMTAATYDALADEAALRLGRGETALAVGTFVTRAQRQRLLDAARRQGVALLFVELTAAADVVIERLRRRPPGLSDGTVEVYRSMARSAEPPVEVPPKDHLRLDAGAAAPETLAEEVLAHVRRPFEGGPAR